LYKQKQVFVEAFIHTAKISTDYKIPNLTANLSVSECTSFLFIFLFIFNIFSQDVTTIEELISKREGMRSHTLHKEQARNIVVTTIIMAALGVCLG